MQTLLFSPEENVMSNVQLIEIFDVIRLCLKSDFKFFKDKIRNMANLIKKPDPYKNWQIIKSIKISFNMKKNIIYQIKHTQINKFLVLVCSVTS